MSLFSALGDRNPGVRRETDKGGEGADENRGRRIQEKLSTRFPFT